MFVSPFRVVFRWVSFCPKYLGHGLLLFQNNIRFYGSGSRLGNNADKLRRKYIERCVASAESLAGVAGGEAVRCLQREAGQRQGEEEEDVIRCPCGQLRDEGVMVQCEECSCWQHTDCVATDQDPATLDK